MSSQSVKRKLRMGVVLSSGGVRGVYAHSGFMRALQQLGIHYDAITGCSAGAIVGGVLASGTTLDNWEAGLQQMKPGDFWSPDSMVKFLVSHLLRKGRGYLGLSTTDTALRFTQTNVSATTFEECVIPFSSLAINLGTREKTVFNEGELAPRIVASASIPVLYEPIEIDGDYYCDGALIDFAPTDAICCKHHLDVVIVHHVAQSDKVDGDIDKLKQRPWSLLEIINRLLFRQRPWYLDGQPLTIQRCPCECGAIIIAVEPQLPELVWPSTKGCDQVQVSALEQAIEQLQPHSQSIVTGDLKKLQALVNTDLERYDGVRKGCMMT